MKQPLGTYTSLEAAGGAVAIQSLAMGFFDGLHLGHQAVLESARRGIDNNCWAVLTFQTHPQAVLFPERSPALLMGWPHKQHRLTELGIPHVLALPFNEEVARIEAESFLHSLAEHLPALRRIAVGPNWRFGHNRKGTIEMLARWCQSRNIELSTASPANHHGEIISSSRIRECVQSGNILTASELLGHPYGLYGPVVHGQQLGRQLGFPTLNLSTEDKCLPPHGVYAGSTLLPDGQKILSAINIGQRPSVNADNRQTAIESHLLDFTGDLYDAKVLICPERFIRGERSFSSKMELRDQIALDVAEVRNSTSQRC